MHRLPPYWLSWRGDRAPLRGRCALLDPPAAGSKRHRSGDREGTKHALRTGRPTATQRKHASCGTGPMQVSRSSNLHAPWPPRWHASGQGCCGLPRVRGELLEEDTEGLQQRMARLTENYKRCNERAGRREQQRHASGGGWWAAPGSTKAHPVLATGGSFVVGDSGSATLTMTTGVDPRQFRTMEITAESPGSGALHGPVLLSRPEPVVAPGAARPRRRSASAEQSVYALPGKRSR